MLNFIKQNEQWVKKAQEAFDLQQKRKALEAMEDQAILELKELSGDLNSFGGGFKYECSTRAGTVDYKAIPQLKGVNLDMYRKPASVMWKLSYVGSVAGDEHESI
jgi:hypothetical protein